MWAVLRLVGLLLFCFVAAGQIHAASISGTVYEDKDYGGGSGRSLASSSGTAVPSARVELYTGANYTTFTTTDASGNFTFTGLATATYTVRVVNGTVNSSRTGTEVLPPVQTYRTDASSGAAVAVTDHVGGEVPASVDAGNGSTTLAALTVGAVTPQSITSVVLGASNITGVEFGYSYDVIVNKNDTGQGSLRQFLLNANALSNTGLAQSGLTSGIDNAVFMLADGTARAGMIAGYATQFSSGIASVTLASTLPTISDPVKLDASLQPGYVSTPMIELNGTSAGAGVNGLTITAGSSTVRGFIINRFTSNGINITTNGSNTITGNYTGTNAAGTAASANTNAGIYITSTNNIIGGTSSTLRNIVSGNTNYGIYIDTASATGNTVQGNYVGTNAAGTSAVANTVVGVVVSAAAASNTIGGTAAGAGNVISGNSSTGVYITGASPSNIVQGNYIGTNAAGSGAIANTTYGVAIDTGSALNTIGGTAAGAGNVISGNAALGIIIAGAGTNNNTVLGNYIGINAAGSAALANGTSGVQVSTGAANNTVGGTTAAARNIISGNTQYGVYITDATTTGSIIQSNYIGTNAAGTSAVGNVLGGVYIVAPTDNHTIGGAAAGAGNLISGNGAAGVIIGVSSIGNAILNNSIYGNTGIGIDLLGSAAANNGTKNATTASNSGMDSPVFTTGAFSGTTLTLAGYVGSAASQSTFANASVQVYKADNDATGYGEGQIYLGTITADASGNLSGTITVASGLTAGDKITGIATDASNNSSEFGINFTVTFTTKTFTGTGNFSTAARWTGGTLPQANDNLIIDGACTIDNNAGTDSVAYGTLTIGTATGRTLNWAASGTNRLNVTTVSAGTAASILDMTNGGTLIIGSTWTSTNLTLTPGAGTIEVKSTITLPAAYTTYNSLTINGSGITGSLAATTTLTGDLTITAGTFNANNFNLTIGGNWINNASTSAFTGGTATATMNGTAAKSIGGSFATTFNNLTIAASNTITAAVNCSVSGNLLVSSGTLDLGSFTANRASAGGTLTVSNGATLKIGGTNTLPSNYSTHSIGATSTVEYSGTDQSLAFFNSSQDYGNLKVSGTGTKTLAGNVNVGGTLTFSGATITTGASTIYLKPGGTVSRTSGHVFGNFKKNIATGATSKTFEIGGPTNYTPVTVAFASVTTAGDLTGSVVSGDHANIGTSTINAAKSVNRNWTLTNTGIVFTNYDATFTFVAGDVDSGASTSAFIVGRYSAGWTYPTVGTLTSTTTQATGLTAFGGFQLGEGASQPPNVPLVYSVVPSSPQPPGTDLAYTVVFTNSGGFPAQVFIIIAPIPTNTDFKLGSQGTDLATTGLTVVIDYSNDNASTWTYTPVSGAGGVPAGYDRLVTHVRWRFTGNLSQTAPNNTGNIAFTARIR